MAAPAEPRYRWWPRYRPGTVELGGAGIKVLLSTTAGALAVCAVLCLPPVVRATGLSRRAALAIMLSYLACMWINDYVLQPLARRSRAGFNLQLTLTPLYNVFFMAAFVVVPNEPKSPLWMGLFLWSVVTASWQEIDASFWLLFLNVAAPLATIPIFLARGASTDWSIAAPALCAVVSGLGYHLQADVSRAWRRIRAEQAATIDELRARAAELERKQLARDLHDSVGSALALVGLYGDLVERHLDQPTELKRISATLREAAREGLGDLRGVLDAMAPAAGDFGTLAATLRRLGQRVAEAADADLSFASDGPDHQPLDGPVRLALVRVFQESLNNAFRHGRARKVSARLAVENGSACLEVSDDGTGFDPATAPSGRGLAGMRTRAGELGGKFALDARPGAGVRLRLDLPVR
jgi:signal transduction histidine kinase